MCHPTLKGWRGIMGQAEERAFREPASTRTWSRQVALHTEPQDDLREKQA
jgi:type IV secretory pathway VirD2 relaxase